VGIVGLEEKAGPVFFVFGRQPGMGEASIAVRDSVKLHCFPAHRTWMQSQKGAVSTTASRVADATGRLNVIVCVIVVPGTREDVAYLLGCHQRNSLSD